MSNHKSYTRGEKLALLEEHASSGLSRAAFCAQKEIPYSTFKNWRAHPHEKQTSKAKGFCSITAKSIATLEKQASIHLLTPSGHRLSWPANISSSEITPLLRLLGLIP